MGLDSHGSQSNGGIVRVSASNAGNKGATMLGAGSFVRPRGVGKFIVVGEQKLYIRGETYGAFRPDADGNEYQDFGLIDRDFAHMAASGLNAVRIPHTIPPRPLLDLAHRHGLYVMVGLSAEQYVGY